MDKREVPGLPGDDFIHLYGNDIDYLTIRNVDVLRVEDLGGSCWICAYVGDRRYVLNSERVRFDYWEDDDDEFIE